MFYLQQIFWLVLQIIAKILFYLRIYFCKIFNYPILPVNFYFENLSCWWLYFLVFFYNDLNYLAKIPLSKKDFAKIRRLRSFVKLYPTGVANFFFYKIFIHTFKNENYKYYKVDYKIFAILLKHSEVLSRFFPGKSVFLKFIFFRKFIFTNLIMNFFIQNFLKKWFYGPKYLVSRDIFTLLAVFFFSKSGVFNCFNTYRDSEMFVTYQLLTLKKKSYKACNNYYYNEDLFYVNYFKRNRIYHYIDSYIKYMPVWRKYNLFIHMWRYTHLKDYGAFKKYEVLEVFKNYPIKFTPFFKSFISLLWPTKYQNSVLTKFIDYAQSNNTFFFLRKNKIFNKGRYSRNRQIYRTGVYMCLYINVIFVYFYIFAFYKFSFNFGFLWYGIGFFILSMTFSRAARYRFYNISNFINELFTFYNWFKFFFCDLVKVININLNKVLNFLKLHWFL